MKIFEVFKFESMEKDLEERHPHKVVAIDYLVGRNLFGEIDVHLLGKSGRVVLDLEVVKGER